MSTLTQNLQYEKKYGLSNIQVLAKRYNLKSFDCRRVNKNFVYSKTKNCGYGKNYTYDERKNCGYNETKAIVTIVAIMTTVIIVKTITAVAEAPKVF